ncbi:hypothetical protein [Mycoplasma sp. HU2014]|uniref:hypothetical protein n=1 Tax=Mycoplasma sp. HU2014 TaxID=1664275 RepID=UPI00067E1BD9|nr:hypothetical protein [Mycoplasma sp. HU2014]KNG79367.1 membrane protein [Mycoplasma sp. HU2014]
MKKISRYLWILILFIVGVFAAQTYLNKNYDIPDLTSKTDYRSNYNRRYGLMWGGHALRYYLYRNSSAFDTNKTEYENFIKNIEDQTLNKEFLNSKQSIVPREDFKYSLISSVMVTSEYGSTSAQEFFAESFSKYVSSNNNQKNVTWYLLEHFFTKTFIQLKNNFSGGITNINKWKRIRDLIDEDANKVNKEIKYDINLDQEKQNLTPRDLGYTNVINDNQYIYGFFNRRYVTDTITNLGKQIFSPDFKFSDYTLSRIGQQKFGRYAKKLMTSTLYNPYQNRQHTQQTKNKRFNSIDQLDKYWKDISKFKTTSGIEESSIQIKRNLDAAYEYDKSFIKEDLYEETLKLFNIIYKIAGDDFKKIFINLILTNDKDIKGIGDATGVNGITSTQSLTDDSTTVYSFIIIRNKSFESKENQHQFNWSWFSSNNRFQTLNHEFGHVLDVYLSRDNSFSKLFDENDYKLTQQGILYAGDTPVKDVYALVDKKKAMRFGHMSGCKCCC